VTKQPGRVASSKHEILRLARIKVFRAALLSSDLEQCVTRWSAATAVAGLSMAHWISLIGLSAKPLVASTRLWAVPEP
jgi:hypothetical protein